MRKSATVGKRRRRAARRVGSAAASEAATVELFSAAGTDGLEVAERRAGKCARGARGITEFRRAVALCHRPDLGYRHADLLRRTTERDNALRRQRQQHFVIIAAGERDFKQFGSGS